MLARIISFSVRNKTLILLLTAAIALVGLYSLSQIPIGAVPDVTNNQVQVITTSRNLSTLDMEQFITYPVELEMANLPGVREIRSISKFGISVVTIVFEDHLGTYLPRQLIAEKIESAAEKIPAGFGKPEMGPISTGLGEIYQYVLDVKPEYRDRYSPTELRTIQDWIVKRQLAGIPGVVEVNTWGGYLKQYEVALDNGKLLAMGISAQQVFRALEENNSVAGGGYIERIDQAYFIRGDGMVQSLEDIRNTPVINRNGLPVFIKDVAQVRYGSALRFGAITGNGEGEKVLGQVMMLKDADSRKVIQAVKQRVEKISTMLPEGVYINAFLDRSELIGRTTHTIGENLLLGCLIVIFVVVLLLGNYRSGLIIASVIPLCLLFALTLMYLFGIDANLMSLGAIDFGIIIDGSVIIVEFIAFRLSQSTELQASLSEDSYQQHRDEVTIQGASQLMKSAVFGQLIILIVFIPVLSLSGVEGKMFIPMALTFMFALLGAMLFCFTYVPVMSALLLRVKSKGPARISQAIIGAINRLFNPILETGLRHKRAALGIAVALLISAIFLYTRIGAEFVPTLDEGDFVIQPVLKTGTSLGKTIDITTRMERILLDSFPEVEQVVTRIGAAEVPTDPMSMEESDVIIRLAPRDQWVSGNSKAELAERFKEALSVFPGMEIEFTQPIEMRFNELITGVRADIAIMVFGDDLSELARLGERIKTWIRDVPGAEDVVVEKIEGLPQMFVDYRRDKIARYGLSIGELNDMISMGFAGRKAGDVFEGERRFDLVVRLQGSNRKDLSSLQNLFIDLPSGGKVPLSELADIRLGEGAAKISRDGTRRRIVVGVNVRNRDLQSVVDDIRSILDERLILPVGYSVSYGGQFENLENARKRLAIAVPISLALIFIMLYFAFSSFREALLTFTAIPLSAVGGVWLLWLRGMPFSISAGIGFIALFGISVLNGIVLMEHFKSLNRSDFDSWDDLIKQGTRDRIRAVLLTASAAALGFLPMAVSTSAGAEVQRPLATVVIGGLITATLLTLVVLPILYSIYKAPGRLNRKVSPSALALLLTLLLPGWSNQAAAQNEKAAINKKWNLSELTLRALEEHPDARMASWEINRTQSARSSAWSLDKTQIFYGYDQNNLASNNVPLRIWGVSQSMEFPTRYFARAKLRDSEYELARKQFELSAQTIRQGVALAYYEYLVALKRNELLSRLDSLYERFDYAARRRYELGETNYLEQLSAQSQKRKITLELRKSITQKEQAMADLKYWARSEDEIQIEERVPVKYPLSPLEWKSNPLSAVSERRVSIREKEWALSKQNWLPDLHFTYFQGSNPGLNDQIFGYQLGISLPIFFTGRTSEVRQARFSTYKAREEYELQQSLYERRLGQSLLELRQQQEALDYYEQEGNALSAELLRTASSSYRQGEIDFFQYILALTNGIELQLEYLDVLEAYNRTAIRLTYMTP